MKMRLNKDCRFGINPAIKPKKRLLQPFRPAEDNTRTLCKQNINEIDFRQDFFTDFFKSLIFLEQIFCKFFSPFWQKQTMINASQCKHTVMQKAPTLERFLLTNGNKAYLVCSLKSVKIFGATPVVSALPSGPKT